jgi:hypothetical protein
VVYDKLVCDGAAEIAAGDCANLETPQYGSIGHGCAVGQHVWAMYASTGSAYAAVIANMKENALVSGGTLITVDWDDGDTRFREVPSASVDCSAAAAADCVAAAALHCGKEAAALNRLLEASADGGGTPCTPEHLLAAIRSEAHVAGQFSLDADGSRNASAIAQVKKTPSWPRSWDNCSLYCS